MLFSYAYYLNKQKANISLSNMTILQPFLKHSQFNNFIIMYQILIQIQSALACYKLEGFLLHTMKLSYNNVSSSNPKPTNQSKQKSSQCISKKKRICKLPKLTQCNSKFLENEDTNQTIPQQETNLIVLFPFSNACRQVCDLIKDYIVKGRFGPDTYLASLKILRKIKFGGNLYAWKMIAAAIVSISAKVHEFRVPNYEQLIKWGKKCFGKDQILKVQTEILIGIDFSVPLINQGYSRQQLVQHIQSQQQLFPIEQICIGCE